MSLVLPIEKDLIPYDFDVTLSGKDYNFMFEYNQVNDGFTCTLSKDSIVLVASEPVIYGTTLFESVQYDSNEILADGFFSELLLPYDFSGESNAVNSATFGTNVQIFVLGDEWYVR